MWERVEKLFRKAQITAEFLVVVIVLLFILNLALVVYSNNSGLFASFEENSEAKSLAFGIGNALDETYLAGNGASSVFIFTKRNDFNASVQNGILMISSVKTLVDFPLLSRVVDFNGFEFNKKLKFSNLNGVVVVESLE